MSTSSAVYIYFFICMLIADMQAQALGHIFDHGILVYIISFVNSLFFMYVSTKSFIVRISFSSLAISACVAIESLSVEKRDCLFVYPVMLFIISFWGRHIYKEILNEIELEKRMKDCYDEIIERDFPFLKY